MTVQRLVLFDLDDTLVERGPAFRRWAAEFCARERLPAGALPWLVTEDAGGATPRERFFEAVRARFGLAAPAGRLWGEYRRRMPDLVTCRPGVLDLLEALRREGWRIGIVTNGRADNQLAKIRRTGLAERVDAWAVSEQIGARKPDRAVFAAAAHGCGLALTGGGWVVGDNPVADVEGGRAAGLATIWISRERPWPAGRPPPDRICGAVEAAAGPLLAGGSAPP